MASAIATVWKIPSQFTVVRKRRTTAQRLLDELSNDERLQDPELAFKKVFFAYRYCIVSASKSV